MGELGISGRINTSKTTSLVNLARILRRVLEIWEDLLSLRFQLKILKCKSEQRRFQNCWENTFKFQFTKTLCYEQYLTRRRFSKDFSWFQFIFFSPASPRVLTRPKDPVVPIISQWLSGSRMWIHSFLKGVCATWNINDFVLVRITDFISYDHVRFEKRTLRYMQEDWVIFLIVWNKCIIV